VNAVNLIPSDARRKRASLPTSKPTLALFGGLVVVLVAAVLYVSAHNQVTARQARLSHLTTAVAAWNTAAGRYSLSVQEVQARTEEMDDIKGLVAGRYPWSELLSQLGAVMPADAALSSLSATASSPTATATSSTGTSTSSTSATSTASSAAAVPVPAVQINGCALTHTAVANTMNALQRISGVTIVSLSQSQGYDEKKGQTGGAGTTGCPFTVQFSVSLTFSSPSAAGTTSATASTSGSTAPTAAAGTTTTTGAPQ
jgi:peptidoglycan DL-endopeptidase CwlO